MTSRIRLATAALFLNLRLALGLAAGAEANLGGIPVTEVASGSI